MSGKVGRKNILKKPSLEVEQIVLKNRLEYSMVHILWKYLKFRLRINSTPKNANGLT